MARISSTIKTEPYRVEIQSPSGNIVVADEPVEKGGKDSGFSPKELLAAALAACTSATVRMYADRKEWHEATNNTLITRRIEFLGNLDEEQRRRLLAVANACPVHKILSNPVEIKTIV